MPVRIVSHRQLVPRKINSHDDTRSGKTSQGPSSCSSAADQQQRTQRNADQPRYGVSVQTTFNKAQAGEAQNQNEGEQVSCQQNGASPLHQEWRQRNTEGAANDQTATPI